MKHTLSSPHEVAASLKSKAALILKTIRIEKMAVSKISQSGDMEQLLNDAGISAAHLVSRVKELVSGSGKN